MSMKLSYRDKVIAIVVICIVVIVAGVVLFVKPRVAELDVAKQNLDRVQQEMNRVQEKINTLDGLIISLKDTAKEIDTIQQNFYVEAEPYEFEQHVREILAARNIEYSSITTSYASAQDITQYFVDPIHILAYDMKIDADIYNELPQEVYDAYKGAAAKIGSTVKIGTTNIVLSFKTAPGADEVLKCLDDLAKVDKTLIVNSSDCEVKIGADAGEKTEQTIALTIYSIVPMNMDLVSAENSNGLTQ